MELNQLLVITLILLSSSDGRPSSLYGSNDVEQYSDPNGPNFGKISDIVMNAVNSLKPNLEKVSDYINNAFNSLKPTESDDSGSSYRPEEPEAHLVQTSKRSKNWSMVRLLVCQDLKRVMVQDMTPSLMRSLCG